MKLLLLVMVAALALAQKTVHVREYTRKDGTVVQAHDRSAPGQTAPKAQPTPQSKVFSDSRTLERAMGAPFPAATLKWSNGGYIGDAGEQEISPSSGFVPSTIGYCISGRQKDQIDEALISATVAAPKDLQAVRLRLAKAQEAWFASTGIVAPAGLNAAIRAGTPFTAESVISIKYSVENTHGNPIKQKDGTQFHAVIMNLWMKPVAGSWPQGICK